MKCENLLGASSVNVVLGFPCIALSQFLHNVTEYTYAK